MHAVRAVQDTVWTIAQKDWGGIGADWILQATPFHRSTKGRTTDDTEYPTAVQEYRPGQEIPVSRAFAPAGFGVGWMVQVDPFQRSARVSVGPPVPYWPTAVQLPLGSQDTADNAVPCDPGGLGLG